MRIESSAARATAVERGAVRNTREPFREFAKSLTVAGAEQDLEPGGGGDAQAIGAQGALPARTDPRVVGARERGRVDEEW